MNWKDDGDGDWSLEVPGLFTAYLRKVSDGLFTLGCGVKKSRFIAADDLEQAKRRAAGILLEKMTKAIADLGPALRGKGGAQ